MIIIQSQETRGSVMTPRDLVWFLCKISGGLGMMSEFCVVSNVGKTLWFCKGKKTSVVPWYCIMSKAGLC